MKLADLGLARSIDETLDTSITRVGTTVGTVDYMSPEQAKNSKATDIRSDIYSLGCTWYHMLTGVPPYGEGSVTNKLQAHATAPLPDPRSRNERIPEGVVAVLHRMMAKQPKDRYQSPAELLEDLLNPGIARASLDVGVLSGLSQPFRLIRPVHHPATSSTRSSLAAPPRAIRQMMRLPRRPSAAPSSSMMTKTLSRNLPRHPGPKRRVASCRGRQPTSARQGASPRNSAARRRAIPLWSSEVDQKPQVIR